VNNNQKNSNLLNENFDIKEIMIFFKNSSKIILFSGIIGIIISLGYIVIKKNEFQATVQIQFSKFDPYTSFRMNEVKLIIDNKSPPSLFSEIEKKSCGLNGEITKENIAKLIKLTELDKENEIYDLKIQTYSRENAINCLDIIYEKINLLYNKNIEDYLLTINEIQRVNKVKIEKINEKILENKTNKNEDVILYLISRDEKILLTNEIEKLEKHIISISKMKFKKLTKVYASNNPVGVDNKIIIIIGLLFGLIIGLIFSCIIVVFNDKKYLSNQLK
jgi:hypothetical protein